MNKKDQIIERVIKVQFTNIYKQLLTRLDNLSEGEDLYVLIILKFNTE